MQYDGEIDVGYISLWMRKHSMPTIVKFGVAIQEIIFKRRSDLVIFFDKTKFTNEEEKKAGVEYRQAFADVAAEMKG